MLSYKIMVQSLIICMTLTMYFFLILGKVTEMSGGDLGRSRSLVDIRSLRGPADTSPGDYRPGVISGSSNYYSEAEGLELLAQDSPGSPLNENSAVEHITGLLDYESDGQEQTLATRQPAPCSVSTEDLQHQAAMDVEPSGSANSSVNSVMMDSVYFQCRSACISCQKDTLVSVSVDESFGKRVIIQSPSVGSFEDHQGISQTFHGSRIMKGNCTVNESISSSFDPSKLMCVSCETEHPVIGNKPSVFLFSDQNFVSSVHSHTKECVNVVRIENASLLELFETAKEILGNVTLPEGSVFMFGSVSHLSRMGTSLYAKDWIDITALTVEAWHGSKVCPLIPLIRSECVGSVIRELNELSLWFEEVYDSDPQGLHEVWRGLVAAMESASTGSVMLDVMDSYKVLLPGSLKCSSLNKPVTFCSSSRVR
jgi:hypothetical protein